MEQKLINISYTTQEIELILLALGKLPWEQSNNLINKTYQEAQRQFQASQQLNLQTNETPNK